MTASHLRAGQVCEQLSLNHLRQQGMRCVARNYRCKQGELDLVMQDQQCLVIVEVRYRRSTAFGGAFASIQPAKLKRIARATTHFLSAHTEFRRAPLRFDVIAVTGPLSQPRINWRQRAFAIDERDFL